MRNFLMLSLAISVLLVSSCARVITPPPTPTAYFHKVPWATREKRLNALVTWKVRGAFSIDDNSGKLHIANYNWYQQGQTYNIYIHSTLNLYGAEIKGRAGGYTWLYRGDLKPVSAKSPEGLMEKELGYRLPISELQFWLRGLPAASKYRATYDEWGHIKTLYQNGWAIRYSRYRPITNVPFKNIDVPGLIEMNRKGLHAKIALNIWNYH